MENNEEPAPRIGGPVGTNIFRVRRQLRMTQKQLATPEFSISYISAIERGRIRPSLKALDVLARRLSVTSAELLAEVPGEYDEEGYGANGVAAQTALLTTLIRQRPPGQQAALALCWASVCLVEHNYQLATDLLEMLTPAALSAEQRLLRLYFLGAISLAEGHPAEAQAILEPIFQQEEFNNHAELVERSRFILACACEALEQFLPAADAFNACAQAIEKGIVDEPIFTIQVYFALAEHHRRLERRDVAVTWYQQALKQVHFVLNPVALAESSARLSRRHLENVHSTMADWYAARSRVLYELVGARQLFTQAASNLGLTLEELGNTQASEQQLRQTIEFCKLLGTPRQGILTRIALADLLLERHEAQEAERFAREAQALCRPSQQDEMEEDLLYGRILFAPEDETLYGRILVTLADALREQGHLVEAERLFKEAIELLQKQNAAEHLSQAFFRYSTLLNQKGMVAESYEMVKQAFLLSKRKPELNI